MATYTFLGEPPASIKQWILNNCIHPVDTSSLLVVMASRGIDTSSITTPGGIASALSLSQSATFDDCVAALTVR